ncbi:MAG TPA: ATP-dependent DNA helicase, partial [Thermoplasmatales archaeon]|nr:ATP-dependent DNA helicase [Thermoplasmatales archaeon]
LESLQTGVPLVLESGTGSGKTVCAVSASLSFTLENNKKIIYATRTNAQQRQVILEARNIMSKFPDLTDEILAIGIQGRAHMCLLAREDTELQKGSADELARFCSEMKRKGNCKYFCNLLDDEDTLTEATSWMRIYLPTAEEVVGYCRKRSVCPYEINKLVIGEARLAVVPYIYIFEPNLRNLLLDLMGMSEEDLILILDEAHNLPDYLRDFMSAYLSAYMLNQCMVEIERYGNPFLLQRKTKTSEIVKEMYRVIYDLRRDYIENESLDKSDALLPTDELTLRLSEKLNLSPDDLRAISSSLIAYGEQIKDLKQKEKKLPRSYIYKLGTFLQFWTEINEDEYVRLIVDETDGRNPRVEIYCLDPSIGAKAIHAFHTSIHMSGTLSPLEEYRDSLGLPENTMLVSFPSPFPKENRKIIYVSDVSTRYDEIRYFDTVLDRIQNYICSICNSTEKNTIVFFPSFDLMREFIDRGILNSIDRTVYIEKREMSQLELMDIVSRFKNGRGGNTLFSVIGGRISEGMDFPAKELEVAIIVGIPYPKPTARQKALQRYYQQKFGKGWEYAVNAPTARKLLQAIGRLIRNESDRGIAIILDRRMPRFRKYVGALSLSRNVVEDVKLFISEGG